MQFLFQPLTWGFLLVGVPILVHLINMLRHRKQKWAAMEFLLESYRRNRRWVMLKQWLLLASRILAMILLVAMLAKWVSGSQLLSWLGGQTTHHYILLDDSYSMGELDQNETAYSRGLKALSGIVRSISGSNGQHQITLIRWSRAALALDQSSSEARIDSAADLLAVSVPSNPDRLLDRVNATAPTTMQLSPEQSLELVSPLISENTDQQSEVYLVTDMRRNQFGEPEALRNQLESLTNNSAKINIVDCAKDVSNNLSIVSIEPQKEIWAAGVPLMVRFQVRNRTLQAAKNVIVKIRAISYADGVVTPQVEKPYSGDVTDLPPIVIEEISAGETVTRQVQVIFGLAGDHVVEVAIGNDALPADNRRWCTIEIKQSQQVLLVDGEADQRNAFFFEKVINPDPRLSTGMKVEKVDSSYLRDVAPEVLEQFDVVALLDVPRMDPQAVAAVEQYCKNGGGLFMLCGRSTNFNYVNEQLYRSGEGMFPAKLSGVEDTLIPGTEQSVAQFIPAPHPILAPLLQLQSSPFFMIQIRKLLVPEQEAFATQQVEVVATGPNKVPLVLDRPYGKGRVLTVLTGLTNDWSNWAQDPTFVVFTLRSLGYLGSFRRPATSETTGAAIEMVLAGTAVLPEAEILIPARDDGIRVRLQRNVEQSGPDAVAKLQLGIDLEGMDRDLVDNVLRAGVFETWMTTAQGESRVRNFAHNVPSAEGELERISSSEFEQKMGSVPVSMKTADAVSGTGMNAQNASHSTFLMCLLALLLLAEQALAYSASFHSSFTAGRSGLTGRGAELNLSRGRS